MSIRISSSKKDEQEFTNSKLILKLDFKVSFQS